MPPPRLRCPRALGRREFLLGGLTALAALGGCSPADPSVDAPPATPTPTPTTPARTSIRSRKPAPGFPGAAEAARAEQALADLCGALLSERRDQLRRSEQRRLASIRDAHDRHAATLRSPEPIARPEGAIPERDPGATTRVQDLGLRRSLAAVITRERKLAASHRHVAVGASGSAAVLWGSLSVAAGTYAHALEHSGEAVSRPGAAAPLPVLSDVAAMQALVEQLHAVVYGYQLALGRLPVGSRDYERGRQGLHDARALRDRLSADLARRSAAVPVPAPAYVSPVRLRGAASAAKLGQQMELALLPFCGLTLAAATTPADRAAALEALSDTADRAAAWGAAPQVWPGWTT